MTSIFMALSQTYPINNPEYAMNQLRTTYALNFGQLML